MSTHNPENQQELRARIIAGSHKFEDYRALAEILLGSPGREEEGVAVLERALEAPFPTSERAAVAAEIAWCFYQLGRLERATSVARRALSLIGECEEAAHVLMVSGLGHMTLTFCLFPTDRPESDRHATLALQAFERLLSGHPDSEHLVPVTLHAAEVHVLRGDYQKAIVLYERGMRADPSKQHRLTCLVQLGNALRSQGRHVEAEERLREALTLVETDRQALPRIHFELGKVYHFSNRTQEAISAFEQALATLHLNPFLRTDRNYIAEIRWELGDLYYDAKRYSEAITALREALPDLPTPYPYFDTLISLGHCYLITRQYPRARECYEEVLASEGASKEEKTTAREGLSRLPPLPPPRVH